MKKFCLLSILAVSCTSTFPRFQPGARTPSSMPAFTCETKESTGTEVDVKFSQRQECQVPTDRGPKTFYVFKSRGTFSDISYDHGRLLADKVAAGLVKDLHDFIQREMKHQKKIAHTLLDCYSRRIQSSVTPEFSQATESFMAGFKQGMKEKKIQNEWSDKDLRLATVVVDAGIALEGFKHRVENRDLRFVPDLLACVARESLPGKPEDLQPEDIGRSRFPNLGGCTGIAMPSDYTNTGSLIHGRNLDGDLIESFTSAPTLFLHAEKAPAGKTYYKYAAAATAGMMYPGGISGFNEKGIAVSLHELQTDKYRTRYLQKRGNVGPYLQQRILREADSIAAALKLAKSSGNFTGWSIFVSDAKTNESATIEFTGEKVALAKLSKKPRAQTNHFYGADMQDQFYNYNFNKYLESRARDKVVSTRLQAYKPAQFGLQDAVELLANHEDAEVPAQPVRSFGRTVVKAYTTMSTIMLAHASRQEIWISLGERYPIPHSYYVGFRVDFNKMEATPLGTTQAQQYRTMPNWEKSLEFYTRARLAYVKDEKEKSLDLLQEAIDKAADDGQVEPGYHFIRARVLYEIGLNDPARLLDALQEYQTVLNNPTLLDSHGYLEALSSLYSAAAYDQALARGVQGAEMLNEQERNRRLQKAHTVLQKLYAQTKHFDLKPKIKLAEALLEKKSVPDLPGIDFVVVEN